VTYQWSPMSFAINRRRPDTYNVVNASWKCKSASRTAAKLSGTITACFGSESGKVRFFTIVPWLSGDAFEESSDRLALSQPATNPTTSTDNITRDIVLVIGLL
jgi:hypothetical protein